MEAKGIPILNIEEYSIGFKTIKKEPVVDSGYQYGTIPTLLEVNRSISIDFKVGYKNHEKEIIRMSQA